MFDTGKPTSSREILASLSRVQAEGELYVGELSMTDFLASQGDGWSPADQVRHLSKSMFPVARALRMPRFVLRLLFGASPGTSRAFSEIVDTYRARLSGGATAGRFAPSKRPAPDDPEAWRKEVLLRWHKAAASLLSAIARWDDPALDRYRLPHPILGRLTIREMLFFTVYHQSHHLNLVAVRREKETSR